MNILLVSSPQILLQDDRETSWGAVDVWDLCQDNKGMGRIKTDVDRIHAMPGT